MLNDFQKGSIFGTVLVGIAFAAALSVSGPQYVEDRKYDPINDHQKQPEGFLDRTFSDPVNIFTLGLVLVGAVQAGLFLWQLDLIRAGLVDAQDAASAAHQSVDLARQQFITTHRPKIIVRFIQGPFVETDGGPQIIWVTVANIGVNKAKILEWGADLARRRGKNWVTPGLDAGPKTIAPILLISGQRHVFKVLAKIPYTDAQIFADAFDDHANATEREELCALGAIRYADENNIVRETGFFRVYHPASETFVPSENTGEEYQD
jgi:hypothetical protein